jgi:hypothetical protein
MRRASSLLPLLCFLLAACDAGQAVPGGDNLSPGPEISFDAPRPDQTFAEGRVHVKVDVRGGRLATWERTGAERSETYRLRTPGNVVHVALDGEWVGSVPGPTKSFELPVEVGPGTHLLTAWLEPEGGDETAVPVGRRSVAARLFHVGEADGRYAWRGADMFLVPFREHDPLLAWAGPRKPVPAAAAAVRVAAAGITAADDVRLVALVGGKEAAEGPLGRLLALPGLAPGDHEVVVELRRGGKLVPGALTRVSGTLVLE